MKGGGTMKKKYCKSAEKYTEDSKILKKMKKVKPRIKKDAKELL